MWLPLLLAAQLYGPQQLPPVADTDDPLVDAAAVVPGLIVDLAYATSDNIVGRALYPADSKCLLRGSVAQRLAPGGSGRRAARDADRVRRIRPGRRRRRASPGRSRKGASRGAESRDVRRRLPGEPQ